MDCSGQILVTFLITFFDLISVGPVGEESGVRISPGAPFNQALTHDLVSASSD
jgi:hypothetical protein